MDGLVALPWLAFFHNPLSLIRYDLNLESVIRWLVFEGWLKINE
jgi:hypothetical protein